MDGSVLLAFVFGVVFGVLLVGTIGGVKITIRHEDANSEKTNGE